MRKILDILRLHFGGGLSNQRIADALKISKGSVFNALNRFSDSKLSWPFPTGANVEQHGPRNVALKGQTEKYFLGREENYQSYIREQ